MNFSHLENRREKIGLDKDSKRSIAVKYVLFDTYERFCHFWSHTRIPKHRSSTFFLLGSTIFGLIISCMTIDFKIKKTKFILYIFRKWKSSGNIQSK